MASNWYFARQGQQFGPVSSGQLREMARTRQVLPTDLIWKQGMGSWVPAGSLPDLFPQGVPQWAAPPQQVVAALPAQPAPAHYPQQAEWAGNEAGTGRYSPATLWYKTWWFRGSMGGLLSLFIIIGLVAKLARYVSKSSAGAITFAEKVDAKTLKTTNEGTRFTTGTVFLVVRGKSSFGDTKLVVSYRVQGTDAWRIVSEDTVDPEWTLPCARSS